MDSLLFECLQAGFEKPPPLQPTAPPLWPAKLRTMEEAFRGLKKIGEGVSGVVYSARERVALKKVTKDSEMSRFEVQCLISYPHPSIIQLKELVLSRVDNRIGYLVLELAHGGDLYSLACDFERLEEVLDEARIRNIMRQLLEGIAHLHSKDIIHGDLKTDNLLLTTHEGQLKLWVRGSKMFHGI